MKQHADILKRYLQNKKKLEGASTSGFKTDEELRANHENKFIEWMMEDDL